MQNAFSERNGETFLETLFPTTKMEQNRVLETELLSKSGFDAKRLF